MLIQYRPTHGGRACALRLQGNRIVGNLRLLPSKSIMLISDNDKLFNLKFFKSRQWGRLRPTGPIGPIWQLFAQVCLISILDRILSNSLHFLLSVLRTLDKAICKKRSVSSVTRRLRSSHSLSAIQSFTWLLGGYWALRQCLSQLKLSCELWFCFQDKRYWRILWLIFVVQLTRRSSLRLHVH